MIKILKISDNDKKGILLAIAAVFMENKKLSVQSSGEVKALIEARNPNFVLVDIKKPVNGDSMYDMLGHIDDYARLRVNYYRLHSPKSLWDNLQLFKKIEISYKNLFGRKPLTETK